MIGKKLLAVLAVLTSLIGVARASPTYLPSSLDNGLYQPSEAGIDSDVPLPVVDVPLDRRQVDAPVMVAIPLPAAFNAAIVTIATIGLLMIVRRTRRLL